MKIVYKILLIGLFIQNLNFALYAQNFNGGSGDGYSGSSINGVDLQLIPEIFSVEITLGTGQDNPSNNSTLIFQVTFNSATTDFTSTDISLSGTAGATTVVLNGSGSSYTAEVSGMTNNGTVSISIPQGVCTDADGNLNPPSTNTVNVIDYDNTQPGIEIVQDAAQADPTNDNIITFNANLTEPISNFSPSYISLSGTAGATAISLRGGPLVYSIDVSGMTGQGTVTVSISAGLFADRAGNLNTESVNTDNTVFYDNTRPNVVVTSTETSPTAALQIPVYIEFSKAVSGFETSDINISNANIASLTEQTADTKWLLVVEPIAEGLITIQILSDCATDISGNKNNASNNFTIEYTRGNNAPLIENQTFTVDAQSKVGTLVGQISARDPDGDALSFSIVSGNTDNVFEVDPTNGDILVANSTALETNNLLEYSLIVKAEDNYSQSMSAQAEIQIIINRLEGFEANNIITPNASANRYWTIKQVDLYRDYELVIRNSAGQLVYKTKGYNNDWNGTFNNKPLPTGTYYYFLTNADIGKVYKGFINIIYQ